MRIQSVLLIVAAVFAANSDAGEVVSSFSGKGSTTTREFDVQAPWIIDWRVNSDYPQGMAIEIALVDADTGFQSGLILQTKYRGDGVKLFNKSGHYKLRISSTLAYWSLRIEQLTKQEAEAYTPRDSG